MRWSQMKAICTLYIVVGALGACSWTVLQCCTCLAGAAVGSITMGSCNAVRTLGACALGAHAQSLVLQHSLFPYCCQHVAFVPSACLPAYLPGSRAAVVKHTQKNQQNIKSALFLFDSIFPGAGPGSSSFFAKNMDKECPAEFLDLLFAFMHRPLPKAVGFEFMLILLLILLLILFHVHGA